jgi:hypothetical protein
VTDAQRSLRQCIKDTSTNGKPKKVFVSANFSVGDLYAEEKTNTWTAFVKGHLPRHIVEASQRPFDQFGFNLGFRRNIRGFQHLLQFTVVSPVRRADVGKKRRAKRGRRAASSHYAKKKFVWGISLNLDTALGLV